MKLLCICFLLLTLTLSACGVPGATSTTPTATPTATPTPDAVTSLPADVTSEASPPAESSTTVLNKDLFPSFATTDLEGNAVDSTLFADNDITMINFWGTYCGPCIDEMPDLGKLAQSMPEGSALVGVVIDGSGNEDLAKQIVSETGAAFPHLLADEGLISYARTLVGVPTTIFIDAQGAFVGEPLLGARDTDTYRIEIETRLALLA